MATYLLTWNPKKWEWTDIGEAIEEINTLGYSDHNWSSGGTKRIVSGDRVFITRQGKEPRGIFASGWVTSCVYEADHWDEDYSKAGRKALFIDIRLDVLFNPYTEPVLARNRLKEGILSQMGWDTQVSGVTIPKQIAEKLEDTWVDFCVTRGKTQRFVSFVSATPAEEITDSHTYFEGSTKQISINVYERSSEARQRCIEHYGFGCTVCGFDFEEVYGSVGAEYVHVHHLTPLSNIGADYELDPVQDLRPVCPNCHAIIHRKTPPYTINEVKSFISGNQQSKGA